MDNFLSESPLFTYLENLVRLSILETRTAFGSCSYVVEYFCKTSFLSPVLSYQYDWLIPISLKKKSNIPPITYNEISKIFPRKILKSLKHTNKQRRERGIKKIMMKISLSITSKWFALEIKKNMLFLTDKRLLYI